MWLVCALGPQFPLASGPKIALVATLAAAGVAFDLMGLLAFRAARTTINPLKPERASAMVIGGVYRISRNPMYVGLALCITRFQIKPEERVLRGIFGEEYSAYAARVRRWL